MARRLDPDTPRMAEFVVASVPVPDYDGKIARVQAQFLIDSLREIVGVEPEGTRFRSYGRFRDDGMRWEIAFIYPVGHVEGEEFTKRLVPVDSAA